MLVVGGGHVATRKVDDLLRSGARVRVVAIAACETMAEYAARGVLELSLRPFEPNDIDGAWLVISATNDARVNAEVAGACEAARIFVCAVDDRASASVFFGSIVERSPFLIAISSEGNVPALTRLLRQVIEEVLPKDEWIAVARDLRRQWKAERTPIGDRFQELVKAIAARGDASQR